MAAMVETRIEGGDWSGFDRADTAAQAALAEVGMGDLDAEIDLLLTDDATIAALNARFRQQDKPTNVLSWPAFSLHPAAPGQMPPAPPVMTGQPLHLGDIAMAAETVAHEAASLKLAFNDHATHLVVHGVLHLLGYDHEHDADAATMEGIERRALARLGVADPYV